MQRRGREYSAGFDPRSPKARDRGHPGRGSGEPPRPGAPAASSISERKRITRKKAIPLGMAFLFKNNAGDHLISHTVARAVPSAQRGLTSVFGMGTGDPSQYGHRQACRGESERSFARDGGLRISAAGSDARRSPQFLDGAWRVVFPAARRNVCCSGLFRPDLNRNAACKLAPAKIAGARFFAEATLQEQN
jgi:hypothetical protein